MISYTEMDINNVLDKFGWEGKKSQVEDISKGLLEIELAEVSYDTPYYGLDKELASYFRHKLEQLAKHFSCLWKIKKGGSNPLFLFLSKLSFIILKIKNPNKYVW